MKKVFALLLLFSIYLNTSANDSKYLFYEVVNGDSLTVRDVRDLGRPFSGAGIDASNILLGITDFAIERSKMEPNIAFFSRFEKFLETNPEAKILFPNTLNQLNRIKEFQFNEFLPKLRSTFFDDLNSFPDNVSNVLVLPRYQKLFVNFPEIKVAIRSLATVSKLKTSHYELSQVISEISAYNEYTDIKASRFLKNYGATWKLVNNLSQAFVDPVSESHNAYYQSEQIQAIIDDPDKLEIIRKGLLNDLVRDSIRFYDKNGQSHNLSELVAKIDSGVAFKSMIQNIANAVSDLENVKKSSQQIISHPSPLYTSQMKREAAVQYLNATSHCIDAMSDIFNMVDSINATPYLSMARNLTQITRDAVGQDYTSVASGGINFLNTVFQMAEASDPKNETIKKALPIMSKLLKYANFAANVVEAKSPKEVKDAIEAVALPPGSSSIKKNSKFNISLQMHLGGSVVCKNINADKTFPSWKNRFNVTLPIGVSFNTGFGKGGSLGFFGSIIDLGALAQFRVDGGTTLVEKIRFQNVLSPGLTLSYGFPFNVPLSLNFGGQYGPGLTHADANGVTIEKPSWRLQFSLTVDIPAFTIFNIADKKTKVVTFTKYDF